MLDEALLPTIDAVNAPFWAGCREGVLRVQRCPVTRRLMFPPRPVNSWSPRDAPEWVEVSGRGTIWSAIEPHPPLMLTFTELAPYNAVIVALEEDPSIRLVGNLVSEPGAAIDSVRYDDIDIGARVRVVFERIDEKIALPRWVLDEQ